MAEFCDECPMKGTVNGEVDGVISGPYSFNANRWSYAQSRSGHVGSLTGAEGGVSELIYFPNDEGLAGTAIESRIDQCTAPSVSEERYGLLRRTRRKLGCPAIGQLMVTDPTLIRIVMPDIKRASIAQTDLSQD